MTDCQHVNIIWEIPPNLTTPREFQYCTDCGAIRMTPDDWTLPGPGNFEKLTDLWQKFWFESDLKDLCHRLVCEARKMRKGYGELSLLMRDVPNDVPPIVCLCGSTRFYKEYREANYQLTMNGNIVLSVGFFPHLADGEHNEGRGCTPEQKVALDELHKRKIDLADWVYVLNVGGYIGDSTKSEIEYTTKLRKPIKYLEPIE